MPFRPDRRDDARLAGWRAFAGRLELEDAGDQAERVRRWLALGDDALAPLYCLKREGQPSLYLFDQRRERGGVPGAQPWLCGVLLRATRALSATPFRALPRRNRVLESLEASRTGSHRLEFADARDTDDAISIFARDAVAATAVLPSSTRAVLWRALVSRDLAPVVVVGDQHMMITAEGADPVPFDGLEGLATDLLTLYALLPVSPSPDL